MIKILTSYKKDLFVSKPRLLKGFSLYASTAVFAFCIAFSLTSMSSVKQGYASGIKIIDLSSQDETNTKGMSLKERLEAARNKGKVAREKTSLFTVRARAGYHKDYDRLVFDGAGVKPYTLKEMDGYTLLSFKEKGSFDKRSLSLSTTPSLKSVEIETIDPLVLRINETAPRLVEKKIGAKLIVDFLRDKKKTLPVEKKTTPDKSNLLALDATPKVPSVDQKAVRDVRSEQAQASMLDDLVKPSEKPSMKAQDKEPVVTAIKEVRQTPIPQAESSPELKSVAQTQLAQKQRVREEKIALSAATTKSLSRLSRLKKLQERLKQNSTRDRLVAGSVVSVSSLKPLEMAVFIRGGHLWIVQSEKRQGVPPIVSGQNNVRPVLVSDLKNMAEAWVLPIDRDVSLQVSSNDFSWDIAIVKENEQATSGLSPVYDTVVHEGVEKKAILLELGLISNAIEFSDPNLGDRFIAVPVNSTDLKVTRDHTYPQFEFIPSHAGVVFKPFTKQLDYFYENEFLYITSMNDFLISPVELAASSEPLEFAPEENPEQTNRRFFNINEWFVTDIGNFNNQRRAFEQQITAADSDPVRVNALINLAKLYFAHGFGHESMGLLRIAKTVDKKLLDNPNFIALEGGAMSLADRHSQAFARLYDARIKDEAEIALWRGYSHARKRNWKAAYDEFAKTGNIIIDYPRVLQAKIVPSLTEATLYVGDVANSQSLVRVLEGAKDLHRKEEAILNYFKGRMAFLNNDMDTATRHLRLAANGADRYYRAKAAFELLKIQREQETLSQDRAAEILERLRYVWRGDNFEINVMEYLSDLYYSMGQYSKSLHMLRNIVPLVADDQERTEAITKKLSAHFAKLFINDESMKLQPLSALALYNEFSELTPIGPQGDIAIQKLAERMVSVDLLDRAARLLEHQIKFRLKGEQRARVGARLAAIRLLDQAPTLALDALDDTVVSNIPDELAEERQLLQARAYSQLNEPDRAIRILAGLNSEMAHRLNIDVNWQAGRWEDAAKAITPLLSFILKDRGLLDKRGRVERLDPESASLILNQAVAFTLAGKQGALRQLYRDYAAVMADTSQNDLFLLITRAPKTGQLADINTLKNHISEVDLFSSFLNAYRADKSDSNGGT